MPQPKPITLSAEAVNELTEAMNVPDPEDSTGGQGEVHIPAEQDPAFDTSLEATQEPPTEEPEAASDRGGEGSAPTPEPPPAPATLSADDYQTWLAYRAIDQRLATDPAFAERFRSVFAPAPPAAPTTPEVPSAGPPQYQWDAPVDDRYSALETRYNQLEQTVKAHQNVLAERVRIENEAVKNRVADDFKTRHQLNAADFDEVYNAAQSYAGLLPSFEQQGLDLGTALNRIFEAAYWNTDRFRAAEMERQIAQKAGDDKRKAKASSLAGTSGSAPRTPTRALTESEHREAMIREVAEAMGQGGTE